MLGKSADEARREKAPTASTRSIADTLARHRSFPGNRPSTTLRAGRADAAQRWAR